MKTFLMYSVLSVFLFTTNMLYSQVPAAPSNLHATAVSSSQIVLHWTDNSHNEDYFNIEMKSPGHDTAFRPVGHVTHNVTTFNKHNLSPNTTYHFRVAAVNHSGSSHYSNIAGATTFHDSGHHSIPNAPSHLIAHPTSLSTTVGLTWQDNSHNESRFVIEIKGPHDSAFHNAGHVGSNITSFTATNLHPNTTYLFRVYATNKAGSSHYSNIVSATTHGGHAEKIDYDFILHTNYPNPFNPVTKIAFEIPVTGMTKLKVYDINGKVVSSLINENKDAGFYEVNFDGSQLSSGIYFYKLESNNNSITKKMFLIK